MTKGYLDLIFFFQAEDGIRDLTVTGVQTCALPISLQKAQMCVGNCQGWGQCQGPPRAGKGGKPGRGVGTWADENGWLSDYVEQTDRWDNSGVERPDMAGGGVLEPGAGGRFGRCFPPQTRGPGSPVRPH